MGSLESRVGKESKDTKDPLDTGGHTVSLGRTVSMKRARINLYDDHCIYIALSKVLKDTLRVTCILRRGSKSVLSVLLKD